MQKKAIVKKNSNGMRSGQAGNLQPITKSDKAIAREKKPASSRAKKRALLKQGKVSYIYKFTMIHAVCTEIEDAIMVITLASLFFLASNEFLRIHRPCYF